MYLSFQPGQKQKTILMGNKMSNELSTKIDNSYLSKENFEHYFRIANMMAKSDMVPKGYKDKPQDVLIALEMGRQLNLAPLQAIQNIAVINGKPALYGDAVLAVCSGHPDFEDISETPMKDKDQKTIGYTCAVKRETSVNCHTFFYNRASTSGRLVGETRARGLLYPEKLIKMRARTLRLEYDLRRTGWC